MKKIIIFALVLSVLFGLLTLPSVASNHKTPLPHQYASWSKNYFSITSQITFTPVATIYFPIAIFSLPPPPPSPHPAPSPIPGSHGIIGKITFQDGNGTYAVGETVFVNIEAINMVTESVPFGIIGLTSSTGLFQISLINGSIPSGKTIQHEDGVAFCTPGTHKLWLSICFSSLQECQGPNGDWERFEPGLDIIVQ